MGINYAAFNPLSTSTNVNCSVIDEREIGAPGGRLV